MVQFRYITIVLLMLLMLPIRLHGQNTESSLELYDEKVIVGNDTVSIIIPEKYAFGRYDRGLYNYLFIPKGQWALGLTASYGEFNTDDLQVLSIIEDFNFKGRLYSVNPSVSYFFSNNQSIGLRFKYTNG